MISIASLILFLGFYILYNTSKKAQLYTVFKIEKWFQKNERTGKIIGVSLLLIPFIILIPVKGLGAGTFIWFIMLMAISSLTIIISPIKLINYKTLIFVFLIGFILETLIN